MLLCVVFFSPLLAVERLILRAILLDCILQSSLILPCGQPHAASTASILSNVHVHSRGAFLFPYEGQEAMLWLLYTYVRLYHTCVYRVK